ncbi:MAG: O-antigen ligase family protein [Candidatus Moranbacteria bacterium]|nr:O-antigen ligase family protein [Candidatus Moranbacteria bacterium]MDZ4385174.1 O-antigen ligase family protein [Candidatus Moranbacteria bacterium]
MYNFLVLLVLYLPFQLAINPMAGVDLASIRIFILVFFAVWLAQGLKSKNIVIKNSVQSWLVASFLFLNIFSLVAAKNTDWSVRKLLFLFSIFPIYFVAGQVISNKKRLLGIADAMVLSGAVIALIGLVQFVAQFVFGLEAIYVFWAEHMTVPFLGKSFGAAVLENPSWLVGIAGQTYLRATSLFPDPHMFSFYLGLLVPLALGLILRQKRRRWLAISAFSVIFLADILTFSRGGYLGLAAGLVFMGILSWRRINRPSKIAVGVILGLGLAVVAIPSPVSQRFISSFDLKEGSNQGRLAMWYKATDVIRENPLAGVGIGNYPLEVKPTATYRDPIYAHNTYLDIAVETGILNALVWIGILVATFRGFWEKSKKESLFFFSLASLVIFAAHSLVETAIYSPVVLALFLIIISWNNLELSDEKNI